MLKSGSFDHHFQSFPLYNNPYYCYKLFYILHASDRVGGIWMDISRKLGILIVLGVPVIVGGGIVYGLFGGMVPVAIWEAGVAIFAIAVLRR
jgi:hypothetical protein